MSQKPSSNRKKAYGLWEQSGRSRELKDIAAELGVSPEQVRKWKSQDKWDMVTLPNMNSNVTKSEIKKKRPRGAPKGSKNAIGNIGGGAPKGNKNAVGNSGGGAPPGNKNAFIHGLREKLIFEVKGLSEDEQSLAMDTDFDEGAELRKTIRDCDLKIIHFEKLKRELLNKSTGVIIQRTSKTSLTMTTHYIAVTEYILRYENGIHKCEKLKVKCLETLFKINIERRQSDSESKENAINQHNEKLKILSYLLNNPAENRKIEDFENIPAAHNA